MKQLVTAVYVFLKNNTYPLTLGFCIVCTLILLYIKGVFVFSFHPDISGSERGTTFGIQIVADNQPLYRNPEVSPFWIVQYAPLYYYLVGKTYQLLNWDPTNIYRIQFLSRVISFVLVSMAMVVGYFTARKFFNISKVLSFIFCCLLFGQLQQWHLTNSRIDSLLFFWTTLYIYIILQAIKQNTEWNRYFVFAAFIAVTAFFTKQSALIHIAVLAAYFIYRQQWFSLVKFSGFTILFFALFALALSQFQLKVFYDNLFGSLQLPIAPGWFYSYTFRELIPAMSVFIAITVMINLRWLASSAEPQIIFISLATFLFFGFATATAFKHGAAVGYYHEYVYVGLLGIFYYFYGRNSLARYSSFAYYFFPAMIGMTMLFFTSRQLEKYYTTNLGKYITDYKHQNDVKKYVEEHIEADEKVVVSGGEDFRGWLLQHMLFRHMLAYQDTEVRFLFESKRFDYSKFYELERDSKIRYLIIDEKSAPHLYAFNYTFDLRDYQMEKEMHGYKIYRLIRPDRKT
ncbi:hypothetical protein DYBT9275_06081 [Dyadobacter sp. CECT 9275]|uniref:Uncharacterized protein n=1 Tax=Dyadobacter helix TaxID=2822344 RepID=A0A916N8W4_9BACT|nr:glycosyltransferase family 39 protein [Dyadobacter sp. CECT 9275]CAG5018836.1 hypothetical protein DYBT9275_06081 [Dyadobacter sp. CECT 9275]